jgi:hypothetical protein
MTPSISRLPLNAKEKALSASAYAFSLRSFCGLPFCEPDSPPIHGTRPHTKNGEERQRHGG